MREKEAKMAVYDSVLEAVGRTPLVRLCRFNDGKAELFAKVEGRNPGGSVKDRVGVAMIEAAERAGALAPGGLIIEPTSGNTGIGLAMAAAVKGYRLILTMPETMSVERRKLLAAYGAELVLTPGAKGMAGAIAEAERLHAANPGSIIPQQFENPANPAAHEASTGPEILEDFGGAPDVFVAGVGTGGTITGVGAYLKAKNPGIRVAAVEPADSPVLSGGKPGPHKLQGIGAGFVPSILNTRVYDEIITVTEEDAYRAGRMIAEKEGLLVGITSGAALWAAIQAGKTRTEKNASPLPDETLNFPRLNITVFPF